LVCEILSQTSDGVQYSIEDNQRQERYKKLLKPTHYSHGGTSRVGNQFLRKYQELIQEESNNI